jgi:OOP family OmpA-OmpF porin
MKVLKISFYTTVIALSAFALQSCKVKKMVAKPTEPVTVTTPPPVEKKVVTAPVAVQKYAPAPEKPDFNFNNIQFEFNSAILKTSAIEKLDATASEMKKFPSAKFYLNGYASIEGTGVHNMALSVDRANSVKTYLSNSGVNAANLTTKGFGTSNPIAANSTDQGKELNRRVEVRVNM